MTGSHHFVLSFVASIVVACLLAFVVFMFQEDLRSVGVPPYVAMFVVFAAGHFLVRWIFSSFVAVTCPFGCGRHGHPIPGRTDRFRCHRCGNDF